MAMAEGKTMTAWLRLMAAVLAFTASAASLGADSKEVTATGWFSDELCARPRVKAGRIGPTNRECAQKCLAQGAAMVFIDEEAQRILRVANADAAKGQEGHYVRVTGSLGGESLRVASVEVLKEYVASCARPRKK